MIHCKLFKTSNICTKYSHCPKCNKSKNWLWSYAVGLFVWKVSKWQLKIQLELTKFFLSIMLKCMLHTYLFCHITFVKTKCLAIFNKVSYYLTWLWRKLKYVSMPWTYHKKGETSISIMFNVHNWQIQLLFSLVSLHFAKDRHYTL